VYPPGTDSPPKCRNVSQPGASTAHLDVHARIDVQMLRQHSTSLVGSTASSVLLLVTTRGRSSILAGS